MSDHLDIAGKPIAVGDFVYYAALWNRSATLKIGKVVGLKRRPPDLMRREETLSIGVVSVDRSAVWDDRGRPASGWLPQAGGKEITLSFLDRLLVVDGTAIPREAWEALESAYLSLLSARGGSLDR